jgi:hypothetical protein
LKWRWKCSKKGSKGVLEDKRKGDVVTVIDTTDAVGTWRVVLRERESCKGLEWRDELSVDRGR